MRADGRTPHAYPSGTLVQPASPGSATIPGRAETDAVLPTVASITVRDVLRLPSLRVGGPEVLAGARNLDRTVRWVCVSAVENIAGLLKGGELLLSTGVDISSTAAEQRTFIDALEQRQVAALIVELGHRFKTLPVALVQRAEAKGLPLVALHREIAFVAVTEVVHADILGRQYTALRRSEQAHRRFTRLMIDGAGIPEILQALAETIANPVALQKAGHGVLYHATYRTSSTDVIAAAEIAGTGDSGTAVPADTDQVPLLAVPVPAAGDAVWGRLLALGLDSPLDDFSRVTAERAVELVALALLRSDQEAALYRRERGNLLAEIAAGQLEAADAAYRAETLGFTLPPGWLLLPAAVVAHTVIQHSPQPPEGEQPPWPPASSTSAWAPVWDAVRAGVRRHPASVLAGPRIGSGDTLVILAIQSNAERRALATMLAQTVRNAVADHFGSQAVSTVAVAVGSAVETWERLAAALNEAAEVAQLAQPDAATMWHDATVPDVNRLLASLRYNPHLQSFTKRQLQPLVEHDRRHATKLLPTLEALLVHRGQKTETARALHLERQSLYARLHNLEKLLDVDLDNPDTRLALHLALKARRYIWT